MLALSLAVLASCQATAAQVKLVDFDSQTNVSWVTQEAEPLIMMRSVIPVDDSNDTHQVGNGYDGATGEDKGTVSVYVSANADGSLDGDLDDDRFDDSVTFMGNSEAHFSVATDMSHKAILDSISGSANAELSFGSVGVSGYIAMASETAADAYVGTYTLFARVKPEKAVLLPKNVSVNSVPAAQLAGTGEGLQPTGAFLGWQSIYSNGQDLMAKTGDEFIQAIELGSWLMVTLKFEYNNAQDKKEIGGRLAVDWAGGIQAEGSADWSSINNAGSVDVTISAYQAGGDYQNLVNILPLGIRECTLDTPEICFGLFSQAVTYMNSDYPQQFQNPDGSLNYGKFNIIRYFTEKYADSGPQWTDYMNDPYDDLNFASRQAMREVYSRWEQAMLDKRRATHLIDNRSSELSSAQLSKIASIKTLSGNNVTNLAALAESCMTNANIDDNYCASNWAAQTFFQSYDQTALEY